MFTNDVMNIYQNFKLRMHVAGTAYTYKACLYDCIVSYEYL